MYRVYNIVDMLTLHGISCSVVLDTDVQNYSRCFESDLVIFCRISHTDTIEKLIDNLHNKNIPTVFDIDDLAFDLEYINCLCRVRLGDQQDKEIATTLFTKIHATLLKCDYITCSTSQLKNFLIKYGKPVIVISNNIGIKQLNIVDTCMKVERNTDKIRIGYFSGSATHDLDFLQVAGALHTILTEHKNVEFFCLGAITLPKFLLEGELPIIQHPLVPNNILLELIAAVHINLAPLELNNIFNSCKSELKIFEAASLRIPTIASNIGAYADTIVNFENGLLARSPEDWYNCLSLLIQDKQLRIKLGQGAHETCLAKFYIENLKDYIISTYNSFINRRATPLL